MADPPTLYCNLAQPEGKRKEPPPFASCSQCRLVLKDISIYGKSVRDRTVDKDGRVTKCVRDFRRRS